MYLIKLDFTDSDHKCYTNVDNYEFKDGFLVFTISTDEQQVTKAIPKQRIKHIQIEQQ